MRMSRLAVVLAFGVTFAACGGGGGGGGGGGSIATSSVLREVALFTDGSYVDYIPGAFQSEASNLEEALRSMGHTVTPFDGASGTDWSQGVDGPKALVIPDLETGDLSAAMDTNARNAVVSFVDRGGILVIHGCYYGNDVALMNAVFGYAIAQSAFYSLEETLSKDDTAAAGTPFADSCPSDLPANNGTYTWAVSSLPAGAKVIYDDGAGGAAVVLIKHGRGSIVFLAYDWWNGKPVGYQDGGWWGVLYRAVALTANFPDVCLIHPTHIAGATTEIMEKLEDSGQFGLVSKLNALTATPSLAQLQAFDAVLVAPEAGFFAYTTMGDVVYDYMSAGGGVVLGMFCYRVGLSPPNYSLGGLFADNGYAISRSGGSAYAYTDLGTFYYPTHPTLAGVQTFDVGSGGYRPQKTTIETRAARIAAYADNVPLVATRNVGGVRRADLGFWPASSELEPSSWDDSTDGALIMANALTWTADLAEPAYWSATQATATTIPDVTTTNSTLVAVGAPTSISRVRVTINLTHTFDNDLDIYLISPAATTVELTTDNGGSGDNFTGTVFADSAPEAIEGANNTVAPFTGEFLPASPLASLNGEDANGTWTLRIIDDLGGDSGRLLNWTLEVR